MEVVVMLAMTVNAGSGSLRVHLVDTTDEHVVDAVETDHRADSAEARKELGELLRRAPIDAVSVVAHRIVHGGPEILEPTVVDPRVRESLDQAASFAPLHVPQALGVLDFLGEAVGAARHVICPDTAFHSALPEVARTYPLPERWRTLWDLRRYGFHGLSYAWALRRTTELLDRPADRLDALLLHLSGGSSVCAVREGRSVDTSMGFTPLEGMAMSKRSGSVDPGMILWLLREGMLSLDGLEEGLQQRSGLFGLSGERSGDTRDLVSAAAGGDRPAALAMDVFTHRVRREAAAAAASLDRLDAVVFTGDIGWDQPEVAESVCAGLGLLGLCGGLSTTRTEDMVISGPDARIPVLAVRSREELQLAGEAARAANAPGG
jgi:acetate kinase